MKILRIDEIRVPEGRQREEFEPEALSDLCEDIALNGLQHAPVVRTTAQGVFLISGERRLRAIVDLAAAGVHIRYGSTEIPLDHIPVTDFGELSDLQAQILELHENIKRQDLTWQERNAAEAKLHLLRTDEALARGEQQTYIATAEEIAGRTLRGSTEQSYATTQVRQAVTIYKHLSDPEVAKAANPKEALKIIQRKETESYYKKLSEHLGKSQASDRHQLLRGDAAQLLPTLPAESFDCILTDPPYGIDAQNFGTQLSNTHKFDDTYVTWHNLMAVCAKEFYRVAKAQAHLYLFCDPERFNQLRHIFLAEGFAVWRTPLIWNKRNGVLPRPEHGPRRTYEAIMFANKGDRQTTGIFPDVIDVSPERTTIHPDQKPVALYADLLRRSTRPGHVVLDSFCGSGTIFVAANQLQLTATGIELEESSYAIAAERLKGKEPSK